MLNQTVLNSNRYNGSEFLWRWNFKIPRWVDKFPPEYKRYRKLLSVRYGWIILFATISILLIMSLYQVIHKKYYYSVKRISKSLYNGSLFSRSSLIFRSKAFRIILFWSLFSVALTFPQTYGDLLLISKRLGRLPMTLLPTIFFLTLRPSPMPDTLYLNLLPMHKWISRLVVLQSILHTVLYMGYFYHNNTMKKSLQLKQIYGWVPMVAFIIIAITSLYPIRRKSFATFFINHYILSWVSVVCLHFHSRPPATAVTILNVAILAYQIYLRFTNTSLVNIQVHDLSPNLKIIEIPKSNIPLGRFQFKYSLLPCSHIRVQRKYSNFLVNIFYRYICPLAHPYSVASVPTDKSILLVLRSTNFELNSKYQYYISGSYDPEFDFMTIEDNDRRIINSVSRNKQNGWSFMKSVIRNFSSRDVMKDQKFLLKNSNIITLSSMYHVDASRVLMIIGGTGISVALPMLRILNILGIPSKIIWIIKDIEDLKLFKFFKNIDLTSIEVYLTSKSYNFEYLNHNVLRLDNLLFDSIDNCDESMHINEDDHAHNKKKKVESMKNDDYEEDIDFTDFKTISATRNKQTKESLTTPPRPPPSLAMNFSADSHLAVDDDTSNQDSFMKRSRSKSFSVASTSSNKSRRNSNNTNSLNAEHHQHYNGMSTAYSRNPLLQLISNNLNLELPCLSPENDYVDDDDIKGTNADNVGINISRNSNNYENAEFEHKGVKKRGNNNNGNGEMKKKPRLSIFKKDSGFEHESLLQNSTVNYGTMESETTSIQKKEYRLPLILETLTNKKKGASIVKHLKIFKGRPTLGQDDFNWCLNHVCGNDEIDSKPRDGHVFEVDFNSNDADLLRSQKRSINLKKKLAAARIKIKNDGNMDQSSLLSDDDDDLRDSQVVRCCKAAEHENIDEILKKVWVLSVGPPGLTARAELWATENRLNFHDESFAV